MAPSFAITFWRSPSRDLLPFFRPLSGRKLGFARAADLAQLVEQLSCKQQVRSSSLLVGSFWESPPFGGFSRICGGQVVHLVAAFATGVGRWVILNAARAQARAYVLLGRRGGFPRVTARARRVGDER